jgi:hypothetical protein
MFGLPLAAILVVAYVYLRSTNRGLEMEMAQVREKNNVLEGEVYRYRQLIKQKEAKLNYLQDAELKRFLSREHDSSYVWLFYREADSTWFVEPSAIEPIRDTHAYHLLIDGKHVGNFHRITDAVGLPKIGKHALGDTGMICFGPEDELEYFPPSSRLYEFNFRNSRQFPDSSF